MSLLSVGNPAWNTIRGVRFTMPYGQTFVPVLVTHDALDDIERDPPAVRLLLPQKLVNRAVVLRLERRAAGAQEPGAYR